MSSLQETLNSLNRKLEQLKQGTGDLKPVETLSPAPAQMTNIDLGKTDETDDMTEIDDHLPEAVESDNEVDEPEPELTTKLNIFRSSDLSLMDFMLKKKEEEEEEREEDGEVKGSASKLMVPTALPAESSLKSRRRKLFKGHSKLQLSTSKPSPVREVESEATKSKLQPSNKFKLRKLFRNSDRNEITIVEKPNPRKIIFRKGLLRGQRRKVGSSKKNDPLVKSLQNQIKSQQSNRLFTKRKPFPAKAPTSTTTATTTTTTTEEVRNTEEV